MKQQTNNSLRLSDEEKLNSYPPTKEQFLNAWKDSEIVERLKEQIKYYDDWSHDGNITHLTRFQAEQKRNLLKSILEIQKGE